MDHGRSPSENEDFRFQSDQPGPSQAANGSSEAADTRGLTGSVTANHQAELGEEALSISSASTSTQAPGSSAGLRNRKLSEKSEYGSIVIPVCGTLSRPVRQKKNSTPVRSEETYQRTVRERIASTFLKDEWADVHFIFHHQEAVEKVPANSYILSVSSEVFKAQFSGKFKIETEIELEDVDCEAFKIMLRYIYTDEVCLTVDNALNVLYIAKRYLVEPLIEATLEFLSSQLTAANVCVYLSQSTLFDEEFLMERCFLVVDAQAEKVLKSDAFKELPRHLVKTIISRDELNVNEQTVFDALLGWAEAECKREQIDVTSENLREILKDLFYEIRFSAMALADFANGPATSSLLTAEEISAIFLNLTAKKKPLIRFNSNRRIGLPQLVCRRFQTCASRLNQWRYRGHSDAIQFTVDRRIFLSGIGLYGSAPPGPYEYQVQMEVKRVNGSASLAEIQTSFKCDGMNTVFPVHWDQPVQIEADTQYTIVATIDGKKLSFFGQEGMPEIQVPISSNSVITFYFESSVESKNGTGVQGGQIPELLFYA